MRRIVSGFAVTLVTLAAVLFVGGSPAAALACPPLSSLCSPAGVAVLADSNAMAAGLTTTGTGVYTSASGAVSSVGWVSTATAAEIAGVGGVVSSAQVTALVSGGVALTLTGSAAALFVLDASDPTLFPSSTGEDMSGWVGGTNLGGLNLVWTVTATNVTIVAARTLGVYNYLVARDAVTGVALDSLTAGNSSGGARTITVSREAYDHGLVFDLTVNAGDEPVPFGTFYPEGHPLWEDHAPSAGTTTVTGELHCVRANGTEYVKTASVDVAAADAVDGKVSGLLPELTCDSASSAGRPDSAPSRFRVGTGDGTGIDTELGGADAPSWQHDSPVEWPDCLGAECDLGLWQTIGQAPAQYCGVSAVGCPDWVTQIQSHPDAYECRYGAYVVDMGYCSAFVRPGVVSPNVGTVTDPDTGTKIRTGEVEDYDPEVGPVVIPWDDPQPDPTPDPAASPDGDPYPEPQVDGQGCWSTSWGVFNPLTWVYRPIQCAFVWAFVPTDGFPTGDVQGAFDDSVLGDVHDSIDGVSDAFGRLQGEGQCGVLATSEGTTTFGAPLEVTTCAPIIDALQPTIRVVLYAGFIVSGVFVLMAAIAMGFDIHFFNLRNSRD